MHILINDRLPKTRPLVWNSYVSVGNLWIKVSASIN